MDPCHDFEQAYIFAWGTQKELQTQHESAGEGCGDGGKLLP